MRSYAAPWHLPAAVLLWVLLLTACGDGAPTAPADDGADLGALIEAQVRDAAALGPGTHHGPAAGTVTIAAARARALQPAPVLLMTFDGWSADGRAVLDGTITYREGLGQAWLEGELRVSLRVPVRGLQSARNLAQGLQVTLETTPTAEDEPPQDTPPAWQDCIRLRGFAADDDAAATARAYVVRQLVTAAAHGAGTHAGPDGGTVTVTLTREAVEGEPVVTLRLELEGYTDGAVVYDGSVGGRLQGGSDKVRQRWAGALTIGGRLTGRVEMCPELGQLLLRSARSASSSDGRTAGG